jgi:hypothetical protein
MVEIDLLEQLINSIDEALKRLEESYNMNDVNYTNRLRVFIFNAYQQIDNLLGGSKQNA